MSRLLFLTHEPPLPLLSGARLRSFHLIRELAGRGHEVSLFALASDGPVADEDRRALEEVCRSVVLPRFEASRRRRQATMVIDGVLRRPFQRRYFHRSGAARALAGQLQRVAPDVVIVGQLYMEAYLPLALGGAIVLDSHNVELRRVATMTRAGGMRALAARTQLRPVARHEAAVVRRMSRTWAVSQEEADHFEAIAPGCVDLVPNGVDCAAIQMREQVPDDPRILFLGRMDYGPNIDGAEHLILDVLPHVEHPGARVRIVGAGASQALRRLATGAAVPTEVTGLVPRTEPYLAEARVLAVSLRVGGGTRLKILEALARGVPVVSTTLGAEGLGLRDGVEVLIADDPVAFAAALDRVLADSELCLTLARAGRETVARRFDWAAVAERADRSLARMR